MAMAFGASWHRAGVARALLMVVFLLALAFGLAVPTRAAGSGSISPGQTSTITFDTIGPGANTGGTPASIETTCPQTTPLMCSNYDLTVTLPSAPTTYYASHIVTMSIQYTWPGTDSNDMDVFAIAPDATEYGPGSPDTTTDHFEDLAITDPMPGVWHIRSVVGTTPHATDSQATVTLTSTIVTGPAPVAAGNIGNARFIPGLALLNQGGANTNSNEPSIRVDPLGHVYVAAPAGIPNGGCPFWTLHPDSFNGAGKAYEYRGKFDTDYGGIGGGDCDIAIGGLTGAGGQTNVAVSSLTLANLTTNTSSDFGQTFRTPANNTSIQSTGVDRQWNAADTSLGQVYMTVHDATGNILLSASTDGGYTYVSNSVAITPTVFTTARSNHFGGLVVNPVNHQLYLPFTSGGVMYIAVGDPCAVSCTPGTPLAPGTVTWTNHVVYTDPNMTALAHDFPVIGIDAGQGVYVGWSDTRHIFVSHSTNPAADNTWSTPVQVDQGPSHSNMFPWMVGGKQGAIDVVFYNGSLASPSGSPCPSGATGAIDDASGVNNSCHNVWRVGFAQSFDGGATFAQSPATDISHRGSICDQGLNCSVFGGDRTLGDFFQVDLDPLGGANIAYTADANQVTYTRQCQGLSATTGAPIQRSCKALEQASLPPQDVCNGANVVVDAGGDAADPLGLPGDTSTADVTAVSFSADATKKTLTTTLQLSNLSLVPVPGTTMTIYLVAWTGPDGKIYATEAAEPIPAPADQLRAYRWGEFDATTNQLKTGSHLTSGSFSAGPGGTITVDVPLDGVGKAVVPVASGVPAVRKPYALTIGGIGVIGSGLVFSAPLDRAPNRGFGNNWSVCVAGAAVNLGPGGPPTLPNTSAASGHLPGLVLCLVVGGLLVSMPLWRLRRSHE
ncbi:MAG: hypothetical protein ABR573_01555 [Candidatus Dormibacteria bacterium]